MEQTRKEKGYEGEQIALDYYKEKGYKLIIQNFTIPGGEVDLVMENGTHLVFIEVKNIIYVDDIYDYITPKKLQALKRTIDTYIRKTPTRKIVRCDVVFVKNDTVYQVYENIEV